MPSIQRTVWAGSHAEKCESVSLTQSCPKCIIIIICTKKDFKRILCGYVCGDMLNLFMDFTSQPDSNAKHFDTTMLRHNHAVVFASGMYKTEGASLYKDDNDGTVIK